MIAVLARATEEPVVREFFELFKTPWEFYHPDGSAPVLLCSDTQVPASSAKLVLIYGDENKPVDREQGWLCTSRLSNRMLAHPLGRIPIYGNRLGFGPAATHDLTDESTRETVALKKVMGDQVLVRVGYDLFAEIRHLLIQGQPLACSRIPTLEMHITLLRELILGCSIPLVEIPPTPVGYNFTACLTHDVDHVGIRNHKFDHTMFGFLYRATIGAGVDFIRGRKSLRQVAVNGWAAGVLPLVHLGLVKDFWYQFDRYLEIEKGLASTFFFVPEKGNPGQDAEGRRPARRAVQYDVAELGDHLDRLRSAGHEIGLHGLDAWRDSVKGRAEAARIATLSGETEMGVRMHWLFFDERSPALLEAAGFTYDSTVGYNGTVGYRAGTTQVFRPLGLSRLLELPLHLMDTALFYPTHLDLSPEAASTAADTLIEIATRFGGVLTVNWHDRSIAPERLWDEFYIRLLDDLKRRGAWFPTASQAVAWFRQRRSVVFESVAWDAGTVKICLSGVPAAALPGCRLRVHPPRNRRGPEDQFIDLPCQNGERAIAV